MASKPSDLRNIATSSIRENPVALRGVDRDAEDYISLRDAISRHGILNPINVREKFEEDGVTAYFEICDGLHRYTSAKDLGLDTIPVNVLTLNDAEVLEAQIVGNLCRVDTKPVEYTKQMQRMFALNPTMTLSEMAERVSQSPTWVQQRLGLLKLDPEVQKLVDDGKIALPNAYALAKLPREDQLNFIDQAITQTSAEFIPTVNARAKANRDAARQGREAGEVVFEPVPHLRKMGELKAEFERASVGPALVAQTGASTAAEGFALALAWVFTLDPNGKAAQVAADAARKQKRDDAKKAREVEKADKKAAEAAEAQAKAREAAGAAA